MNDQSSVKNNERVMAYDLAQEIRDDAIEEVTGGVGKSYHCETTFGAHHEPNDWRCLP